MAEPKKLMRDPQRAMIGGVCAGIGEYLDIDITLVRVLTVLIAVFTVFIPTLIAYVVLWAVMPPKPAAGVPAAQPAAAQQR